MSGPVPAQDAWKTPEIRQAEAALDSAVAKSQQLLKSLEKLRLKPLPKLDTPERVEAIKKAAAKPDAPAELRLVKQKVDAGKLTWEDVASGRAFADPDVRALAGAKLGEAKDMYEELEEGLSPEEVLEAREGTRTALTGDDRTTYPAPDEQPKEFSNEDPLATSTAHETPDAPASSAAPAAEDAFADPLRHERPDADAGSGSAPPEAPPTPPAPDQARHTPHPENRAADDDEFTNPLAERATTPKPAPPPHRRPTPPPDDDDYFGGSLLG